MICFQRQILYILFVTFTVSGCSRHCGLRPGVSSVQGPYFNEPKFNIYLILSLCGLPTEEILLLFICTYYAQPHHRHPGSTLPWSVDGWHLSAASSTADYDRPKVTLLSPFSRGVLARRYHLLQNHSVAHN